MIRRDGNDSRMFGRRKFRHGLLDHDAISVLRKASPACPETPTAREQITILVLIADRLEG